MVWAIQKRIGLPLLLVLGFAGPAAAQSITPTAIQQAGKENAYYIKVFASLDAVDRTGARWAGPGTPFWFDAPQGPADASAFAALRAKADAGDREAMAELAMAYVRGQGVDRDDDAALQWMAKVRGLGPADAMRVLGESLYVRVLDYLPLTGAWNLSAGYGGLVAVRAPNADQQALFWYHKAAQAGDRLALERLADMSLRGAGVPVSVPDAIHWLEQASVLGSERATAMLAEIYEHGLGQLSDYPKAPPSSNPTLNLLNEQPMGQPPDHIKALVWYDRAAKQAPENARYRNAACWMRAEAGLELDKALADCEMATRLKPDEPEYWDSLALVQIRLGHIVQAEAAYDAAVLRYQAAQHVGNSETARALYGRGVARVRLGREAAGREDIGYALGIDPKVADLFKSYGVSL